MNVRRLFLPRAALQLLSPADRSFLLLGGHMLNEINSLNKIFTWSLNSQRPQSRIESLANGIQAQLFARLLAGKLLEAWNALSGSFFGTQVSKRVETSMHSDAREALTRLKDYFGRPNAIHRVRNSFAFHYSAAEFERYWLEVADEAQFEFIFGGTVGNNLYSASELVLSTALLGTMVPSSKAAAMQSFLSEVQTSVADFSAFLEGAILALLERAFSPPLLRHTTSDRISPHFRFEDIAVPYFYETEVIEPSA